jgi:hypothetical protein
VNTPGDYQFNSLPEPPSQGIGSNGYIEYHSVRFRTCKALTASRRPLTDTERISIEAQIKQEWSEMNDKDHAVWTLRSQTRRRQPSPPAISDERPAFCGLWGASKNAKHLIDPDVLMKFAQSRGSKAAIACETQAAAEGRRVKLGAPKRSRDVTDDWGSIFCCQSQCKNVCRRHGAGLALAPALDAMVSKINAWVDQLPKDVKPAASELIAFEGFEGPVVGEGTATMVVALLVIVKGSPKMQMFADCALMDASSVSPRAFVPRDPPFEIMILSRASRLAVPGVRGHRSIAISTSDELAQYLLTVRPTWRLLPLTYEITDGPSLLRMTVFARGEEFEARQEIRRRTPASLLPHVLDLGNPFDFGFRLAGGGTGTGGMKGGEGVASEIDLASISGDDLDEIMDSSEDDASEKDVDVAEAPGAAEDTRPDEEASEEGVGVGELVAAEVAAAVAAAEDTVAEPPLAVAAADEAETTDEIARAIAASTTSELLGYVTCTLAPWSEVVQIARITAWPKDEDPSRQNVAIRWYLHPRCSVTRRRARFTNQELLTWLFNVKPMPAGSTTEEKRAGHQAHMAMSLALLPKVERPRRA